CAVHPGPTVFVIEVVIEGVVVIAVAVAVAIAVGGRGDGLRAAVPPGTRRPWNSCAAHRS
ncbi:hypothetical protein ACFWFU_20895, partial [Streptomyces sp. NPDC060235]|uniref:hypothetical protein n=1 Tax=Streptomyces sp. NPDC060235 TaxID=3347080 RepID=UPI00365B01B9